MKQKERLTPDQRKEMILSAAIAVIRDKGWDALTRESVSHEASIAVGTINYSYGTMDHLRDEVMRFAIAKPDDNQMLQVIAKGLACGNEVAQSAPKEIKTAALTLWM